MSKKINKMPLVTCYNKGCGKDFDLSENKEDACQYHPGQPVFHDALKGWSCCNKKSTDFTQFLSIPGCTRSCHSNVKPAEPEKPKDNTPEIKEQDILIYETRKAPELTPRPSEHQPLVELKRTVAPSLRSVLEKMTETKSSESLTESCANHVPVDTPCKNASCQARFRDEGSNAEKCVYHPGVAVFHEGMKYWSCCQRKTSDFDNFLNQVGCTEGSHLWIKDTKSQGEKAECRFDFHQTGGFAILTVYSKNPLPDRTSVRANRVRLELDIVFDSGSKSFVKNFDLFGVINLEDSLVNLYQSKVEIKMKKADPISWTKLEYVPKKD